MSSRTAPAPGLTSRALRAVAIRLTRVTPGALYSLHGSSREPTARREHEIEMPDDLIGVSASAGWRGVALVLSGSALALDPPVERPEQIVLAVVIDRHGRLEVALAPAAGGAADLLPSPDESSGFVVDVARRVMGLPTLGPTPGTEMLVLASWLEHVLDLVADPATSALVRSWRDVAALHPLVAGSTYVPETPDELAELTLEASAQCPWATMHGSLVERGLDTDGLTAAQVAWMDWPFFARWTLSVHRTVPELLDDLSLFIDGELLADVEDTADALGWLGFAGRGTAEPTGDG